MSARALAARLALLALLAGCASTSPEPAFRDVAKTVEQRTTHRVRWNQAGAADKEIERAVDALLGQELTVDAAVQVALLYNRSLHATYEELSIGQADVVQAGLLKNPVFGVRMTTAERDTLDPNLVLNVTQDFLSVLFLPARKAIAAKQFEGVKLRVADAVLDLAAEVRTAYYALQGAMQVLAMRRAVRDAAQVGASLAERQNAAGNTSDLAFATEQGLFEQIQVDTARSEADVAAARERLTRLMGLWGTRAGFRIAAKLAELPMQEVPLEHLESTAVAQRLDLQAYLRDVQTLGHVLSLAQAGRWTGVVDVGIEGAQLRDGHVALGPSASVELPIFDQRQAAIARVEAALRASEHRYAARAVEIRSEVRAARDRVIATRGIVERYRRVLIPLRERIVALSQQEFDAMLLGVYQLLLAKQNEVTAYREFIEAARDYWIARSDLERAVGVRLGEASAAGGSGEAPPALNDSPAVHQHPHP